MKEKHTSYYVISREIKKKLSELCRFARPTRMAQSLPVMSVPSFCTYRSEYPGKKKL